MIKAGMVSILCVPLFLACTLLAQSNRAEQFDLSGLPSRPTNFAEQQIFEMVNAHRRGDLADGARIQRKLARYYADKGDSARAREAERRAGTSAAAPTASKATPIPAGGAPGFSGKYFGYEGRTLHTWDFNSDGTFLHTRIVSGAGTGVRDSERGTFEISGGQMTLKVKSGASGFVTPSVGGRGTLVGGGADAKSEVRKLKIEFAGEGIVLDGVKMKPKSW